MNKTMHRGPRTVAGPSLAQLMVAALMALSCLGVALPSHAQSRDLDPPDRVARLSDVRGQVWLYSPDANEWLSVARNRPLTSGDRVATDTDARAEIALGSTTLRLDAATELEIVQLDDARFLVHLHKGSAAVRLRNTQAVAEFRLATDEGGFRAQTVGRYRFDRLEQASDLTVIAGQAIFEGRNSALTLTTGQHAQFWLDGGAPQYSMVQPARDQFAGWLDERDRAEDRVAAVRYVSPEMTGAEDLDRYGRWEQTPDYGPIWTPTVVAAGWAPYSTGHWAWVRPWGWTWVDDAPWGFAPFHYGRWVHHRNVWGWAPGTYVARPVYAPALVAWMGGPRLSVSVSIGGGGPPVGWFPLAPREVYVPSYRSSPTYVRNINVTQVTNITNITTIVNNRNGEADRRDFANRRFPNAVTIVPSSVLTGREPVGPSAAQLRNTPQIKAFMAEARPAPTLIAAPVATPPQAARAPEDRPAPRPPFEGRAPGGFAGRGEVGRPEGRGEGGRSGGPRSDGRRADIPPVPAMPANLGPQVAPIAPVAPVAPATALAPPVARAPIKFGQESADIGRSPRAGVREQAEIERGAPPRVVPMSPVQRAAEGDGAGRLGFRGRDGRPQGELPEAEARLPPRAENIAPPFRSTPRAEPPRPPDPARLVEAPRPPLVRAPEGQRIAPPHAVQRMPEPRPAEPVRAPEAQRQPQPEGRAARPEPPRGRDERRDERGDDKGGGKREQNERLR